MSPGTSVTIGIVGVGAIGALLFAASRPTTSSSTGIAPGSVQSQANIIGASQAAYDTQTKGQIALASLATSYETAHDTNQTNLALAANAGATQTTLSQMAANATYQSALLGTVERVQSILSGAQTAQYGSYVTGQSALAADAASVTNTAASVAGANVLAGIGANSSMNIAATNAAANQTIAQIAADAQTAISANTAAANVSAANSAASASKSNGFWGGLFGLGGSIAKIFTPSLPAAGGSTGFASAPTGYGLPAGFASAPTGYA